MLRTLLKLVGAFVLLVVSLVAWIAYRAHDAKTRVQAFCSGVSIGQSSAGLADRARAEGLDVHELPAEDGTGTAGGTMLCIKGVMLARHICEIHHRDGRVTETRVGFVD